MASLPYPLNEQDFMPYPLNDELGIMAEWVWQGCHTLLLIAAHIYRFTYRGRGRPLSQLLLHSRYTIFREYHSVFCMNLI